MKPESWVELAECRGAPVNLFFPQRGESLAAARELCGRCPVRVECLDDAMNDTGLADVGIRGGLSMRQRRALRVRRRAG